jgi:outer membrane biosynthesis protein TonB
MATKEKFLKPNEVTACKRLAVSDGADNKRATALLAVHTGATQVAAGEMSGLTSGQVRYIVRRFRVMRLDALSFDMESKSSIAQTEDVVAVSVYNKPKKASKKSKKDKKLKKAKPKEQDKKTKKSKTKVKTEKKEKKKKSKKKK